MVLLCEADSLGSRHGFLVGCFEHCIHHYGFLVGSFQHCIHHYGFIKDGKFIG
jgi:hypothetical protein